MKKTFGKIIQKKNLSAKRRMEILMMVGALVGLFVGVPVTAHLIYKYGNVTSTGAWVTLGEEDFYGIYAGYEFVYGCDEQTNIVWSENLTDPHQVVLDYDLVPDVDIYSIHFVLKTRLNDIINNDTLKWEFSFQYDQSYVVSVHAYELDENGDPYWLDFEGPVLGSAELYTPDDEYEGNETFALTFDSLDLMVDSTSTGNGILMFSIVDLEYFDQGDIVGFDVRYERPNETMPGPSMIWQYGAGIMGIVLLGISVASTPWWNPVQKTNPGIVDRGISRAGSFVGRKKKRRGKKK